MIPNQYKHFYGDETRWFIGTVIEITDPEELGRVKVRIHGIHSDNTLDMPLGDLPWAHVAVSIQEGGSSGIGTNTGIKPMAQVYGIFLDGKNSQIPLVIGSIPKIEAPVLYDEVVSLPVNEVDETKLEGKTNFEKAFNYFTSEEGGGFSHAQTAGMLGNFSIENGAHLRRPEDLQPDLDAREGDGAKAFGIAQWNDAPRAANREGGLTRYQELLDYSGKLGVSHKTLFAQVSFVKFELYKYKKLLGYSDLRRATTPEEASEIFEKKYERPKANAQGTLDRKDAARKIYERLV